MVAPSMHLRPLLALLALAATALAGCTDDGTPDPFQCESSPLDSTDVAITEPDLDPIKPDADPWDFEATNVRTCSLPAIGWHPLRGDPADPANADPHNYLGEIDFRGDLNLGAVAVLGRDETPMVYLLDITDRANPVVLSTITQAITYNVDVKISDDGGYLFVASQNLPTDVPEGLPESPTGLSTPWGFTIYNIQDPANPTFVQTVTSPDDIGCHMLSHQIIDDTDVVFCVGQQVHAHGFIRNDAGPWAHLGAFSYFPPTGSNAQPGVGCINDNLVASVAGIGQVNDLLCSGPHDMTVAHDPVDDRTYMTVAHWDEGVYVVDVSQPVNEGFVTLGHWAGEGATYYDGNVHTAMLFWVGDQRYLVATPEYTSPGTVPSMWVLDANDLANLKLVAEWYHPGEYDSQGLYMTTHQWQVAPTGPNASIEDTKIYLTYNHNGIWALSLQEILAGHNDDAVLGYNLARTPLVEGEDVSAAIFSTWDVNVVDGYIYGSDRATGLWIFHLAGDELGNAAITGFA